MIMVGVAAIALMLALVSVLLWRRARVLRRERDALMVLRAHARDGAEAHTVREGMIRSLKFVAKATGSARAELVFFQPPNKMIHGASLRGTTVDLPTERMPETIRSLVQEWIRSDPVARALGAGDAHPLRAWLRENGIEEALVLPLMWPEPHGVLVVGGPFRKSPDLELANDLAKQVLETLLRTRREELLAPVRAGGAADTPGQIDPETGLPGEGALHRFMSGNEVAGGGSTAICSIRLAAGPEVTREVGHRLLTAVRGTDLVAKVDEDRFVVVMTKLSEPAVALRTAERLVSQIRRPVVGEGEILRPDCSAGVALWTPSMGVREVLELARAAEEEAQSDPLHAVRLHVEDPAHVSDRV